MNIHLIKSDYQYILLISDYEYIFSYTRLLIFTYSYQVINYS